MTSKDPLVARSVATDDDLAPRPIDPTWIVDGAPQARARAIDFGEDRMISAMIWESTAGTFDWRYGSDEVIHILAGEAELTMADGTIKPIKEGDTVFFPGHQIVRWHIPVYLKKVALNTPEISIPRRSPTGPVREAARAQGPLGAGARRRCRGGWRLGTSANSP